MEGQFRCPLEDCLFTPEKDVKDVVGGMSPTKGWGVGAAAGLRRFRTQRETGLGWEGGDGTEARGRGSNSDPRDLDRPAQDLEIHPGGPQ